MTSGVLSPAALDALLSAPPGGSSDAQIAARYLNAALPVSLEPSISGASGTDLDSSLAELAVRLQLVSKSCQEDAGRLMSEVVSMLPRLSSEMDARVLLPLRHLGEEMTTAEASSSRADGPAPLAALDRLRNLRSSLSDARAILSAMSEWDGHVSAIAARQAGAGGRARPVAELGAAARSLRGLRESAAGLEEMPGGVQRSATIDRYAGGLEAELRQHLGTALESGDGDALRALYVMYGEVGRRQVFVEEYVRKVPKDVHKRWFDYRPTIPVGVEPADVAGSFAAFLEGWYEDVLDTLEREKGRIEDILLCDEEKTDEGEATSVNKEKELSIMVDAMLLEIYRPISSSFAKRVAESIRLPHFSSKPGAPATPQDVGAAASLHASTVQFLSDAGAGPAAAGEFSGAFHSVISDAGNSEAGFLRASKGYVDLLQGIQKASRAVRTDGAGLCDVSSLSDAAGAVGAGSTAIFDLLAPLVDRHGQMGVPYRCLPFSDVSSEEDRKYLVPTLDHLLRKFVDEVVIAIETVMRGCTGTMDAQHVQCGLAALASAGRFRETFESFVGEVGEMVLMDVKLLETTGDDDVLAAVARAACGLAPKDVNSLCSHLANALVGETTSLLPAAVAAVDRLGRAARSLVFHICSSAPMRHLDVMSSLPSWYDAPEDGLDNDPALSYGTLPQPYIQAVGEHMLGLVQALEPFAYSDQLAPAAAVLRGARDSAGDCWADLLRALGMPQESKDVGLVARVMDGRVVGGIPAVADGVGRWDQAVALHEEEEDPDEDEAARASHAFCNEWLHVVGLAVTGKLLERMARLGRIGPGGAAHVAADLGYMNNVLGALGISGHPHPLIGHFGWLVTVEEAELRERLVMELAAVVEHEGSDDGVEAVVRSLEKAVALLRGISTV